MRVEHLGCKLWSIRAEGLGWVWGFFCCFSGKMGCFWNALDLRYTYFADMATLLEWSGFREIHGLLVLDAKGREPSLKFRVESWLGGFSSGRGDYP